MRVQIYRSLDFGSQNPTVCLWIAVDDDNNWFVINEHYESGQTIDYHAGIINSKSQGIPIVATYGDPSGAQWISEFAQRGIYITPANKEVGTNFNSWVRFGIEKVSERLKKIPGKVVERRKEVGQKRYYKSLQMALDIFNREKLYGECHRIAIRMRDNNLAEFYADIIRGKRLVRETRVSLAGGN